MDLKRRTLLRAGSTIPISAIGRAHAAELNYRVATILPSNHPLNLRLQEACGRISTATNGRVEIKVFGNSQLGNDREGLRKLQSGEIDFFTASGLLLSTVVPAAGINGTGFAFKDYRQIWHAMDGGVGAYVRAEAAARNIHVMPRMWDSGFRQTTTSLKAINTPEDFKGLKFRVPVNPFWTSMFAAFGADMVQLEFADLYGALDKRTAQGQENPLVLILAAKFHEVQTYCSLTNHMWDGNWLLANGDLWKRMPAQIRDVIEHEFDQSCHDEREDLVKLNPHLRGDLVELGLTINNVDHQRFRDVLRTAGFYTEWRGKFGETAWRLLEDSVGALS